MEALRRQGLRHQGDLKETGLGGEGPGRPRPPTPPCPSEHVAPEDAGGAGLPPTVTPAVGKEQVEWLQPFGEGPRVHVST